MVRRITRLLLLVQCLVIACLFLFLMQVLQLQSPWLALALSATLVALIRIAITVNSFMLAWRSRSETPAQYRLGMIETASLFYSEFTASMCSSSWSMPFRSFEKRPARQPADLPVLLIHGYGCNSGYWHAMSRRLAVAGVTHHAVNLEPVLADIDSYVASLRQAIETLKRDSGSNQVILLAHSMGGLVARAYLRDHGSGCIAKVIMLGTPHHGTVLANHGIGTNSRQMRCSTGKVGMVASPWLQQLDRQEDRTHRTIMVSIYSHHDNIVSPQLSCHLDGATNLAFKGIGHVALALDAAVQQCVLREISSVQTNCQDPRSRSTS